MPSISDHQTRRSLLRWGGKLGSAAALSTLPFTKSTAGAQTLTDFSVGLSSLAISSFPVWMIPAGGFDKKYGLNLQIVNMNGGNRGIQVLLSGHIQAMHVSLGAMVQANAQGADMRMIAASANYNAFTIFSSPNVKTAADLKGGAIGISAYGSESDIAVTMALNTLGLSPNDVRLVQLGGDAQRLAALSAGQVQAIPLQEPAVSKAHAAGFNVLVDLQSTHVPYIFDGVVVTTDYAGSNRDALTRFLKAYISGAYLALRNQQAAEQVIRNSLNISDPKIIDASYKEFVKLMPADAMPSKAGAENVIAQLQKNGLTVGSKNPDDYLDLSFLDDLKKQGFLKQFG